VFSKTSRKRHVLPQEKIPPAYHKILFQVVVVGGGVVSGAFGGATPPWDISTNQPVLS
jgi:hypothetical protein